MKLPFGLFFSTFFVMNSLTALAGENKNSTNYVKTAKCLVDATDPFDPSYQVEFGKFKGKCLNARTIRPPVILNNDDRSVEIANFYHEGRFWIARIPLDSVTSVMFQGVPFDSYLFGLITIAHGQLRMKFSTPIELRSQTGNTDLRQSLDDIIISSTITRPDGVGYEPLQAKSYGFVTRFLSTTARAVEEISEDKSDVHQYKLDLTAGMRSRLLLAALTESNRIGYFDRYGLLTNNCSTQTMDMLDASMPRPPGVHSFEGNLLQIRDVVEKPALEQFRLRNIGYVRTNDLNTEVTCALPGEKLGNQLIEKSELGQASAVCIFKNEL